MQFFFFVACYEIVMHIFCTKFNFPNFLVSNLCFQHFSSMSAALDSELQVLDLLNARRSSDVDANAVYRGIEVHRQRRNGAPAGTMDKNMDKNMDETWVKHG